MSVCRSLGQMGCICTHGGGGRPPCYVANFLSTCQSGGKKSGVPSTLSVEVAGSQVTWFLYPALPLTGFDGG